MAVASEHLTIGGHVRSEIQVKPAIKNGPKTSFFLWLDKKIDSATKGRKKK
jgi:hypothetical protein